MRMNERERLRGKDSFPTLNVLPSVPLSHRSILRENVEGPLCQRFQQAQLCLFLFQCLQRGYGKAERLFQVWGEKPEEGSFRTEPPNDETLKKINRNFRHKVAFHVIYEAKRKKKYHFHLLLLNDHVPTALIFYFMSLYLI